MEKPDANNSLREGAALEQKKEPVADLVRFFLFIKDRRPVLLLVALALCGFLIAAIIFVLVSRLQKSAHPALPPSSSAPVSVGPPLVPAALSETGQQPVETQASLEPQAPVYSGPLPDLSLSGILFSDEGSLALINGKVVPEGGIVDGVRLEKIGSDSVEMSYEGRVIILRSR